jgi:hypothetical protein
MRHGPVLKQIPTIRPLFSAPPHYRGGPAGAAAYSFMRHGPVLNKIPLIHP